MLIILMTALLTFRTPSLAPLWLVGTAAAIPLSLVIGPMGGAFPRIPVIHPWSTALALIPAAGNRDRFRHPRAHRGPKRLTSRIL